MTGRLQDAREDLAGLESATAPALLRLRRACHAGPLVVRGGRALLPGGDAGRLPADALTDGDWRWATERLGLARGRAHVRAFQSRGTRDVVRTKPSDAILEGLR
jgi:hypothetical protein